MFFGKVVIITGANSGIGAATAIEFSKLGAKLVIADMNTENIKSVFEQCIKASPEKLEPMSLKADITKETDVQNIIKSTVNKFQKIDVLVNNAGIMEFGTIETTTLEQYDRVMDTNMRGAYYLTMLATPYLIETKGNIVNVSSVSGLMSLPNNLAYCMSKSSLDQFTRCVALELGSRGVRVNAVNPGATKTGLLIKLGMSAEQSTEFLNKSANKRPLRCVGEPTDVALLICFLASDSARNITGVTVPVDGGRHTMCPN